MSKIIKFKDKNTNVLEFLDAVKEEIKDSNIDNMMIASKVLNEDGTYSILIGYTRGMDIGTKVELNSHFNLDIVKQMIDENY